MKIKQKDIDNFMQVYNKPTAEEWEHSIKIWIWVLLYLILMFVLLFVSGIDLSAN